MIFKVHNKEIKADLIKVKIPKSYFLQNTATRKELARNSLTPSFKLV